ncbi:tetratricopeptide repeat protein [Amaricoccus solimangrovi]|uniref:Tetratricopeptide repeat protein n=1 Tax=Amaricoccus solimangrovi TaxID=2589815 RepID=A0A501WXR7_9RHOB|nr:tetratricopeptide repeat protein [Amaricoccus solimangrovi]TPE52974.1 tetratricopeptide repeat protein [Amaricoccus solimangrovi]
MSGAGAGGPEPLALGLVGALESLPRRLASRALAARGGTLHRGIVRRARVVVFGRSLLRRLGPDEIAAEVARAGDRRCLGENGFLRLVADVAPEQERAITRAEILARSGLAGRDLDLLSLFDAFAAEAEPYAFRDVILARKYAGLIAGGADWAMIARSVHRHGPAVSLTAKSLELGPDRAIYLRHGTGLSEIDGQLLLGLDGPGPEADALFAEAEAREAAGDHAAAAALYARCLAADPSDSDAAFNRANCLRAAGRPREAEQALLRALSIDPDFVEAWFNLAGLMSARGRVARARDYLARAIAIDPGYADAVYNLASLEFDAGEFAAARTWWERYLELDSSSEWARRAARGIAFLGARGGAAG